MFQILRAALLVPLHGAVSRFSFMDIQTGKYNCANASCSVIYAVFLPQKEQKTVRGPLGSCRTTALDFESPDKRQPPKSDARWWVEFALTVNGRGIGGAFQSPKMMMGACLWGGEWACVLCLVCSKCGCVRHGEKSSWDESTSRFMHNECRESGVGRRTSPQSLLRK